MSYRTPSGWLYTFALACVLAGSPSCSDDPVAPEEPDDSNVSVESSNREVATIGAGGGSVSTTSDAGITYTLDIPPDALPGDVEIAITPVTAINNLPFEGRLEGAVRLGPSGLRLLVPAVLTIDASPTTTGAERLVGFAYEGDASSFEPAAAIDGTTEIRVPITHFSGAGAASSEDADDWLTAFCAAVPTLAYTFTAQMDNCWTSTDIKREHFFRVARDYLEDLLMPLAQGNSDLSVAVTEYIEWYLGCDELAAQFQAADWETVLATEIATLEGLIQQRLVTSIAEEKTALCSQGGTEHLRLIFEYRFLAIAGGFEETSGLSDEEILDNLCAEIRIPEITLADPMPMNQGTSLDARAELWINNQREGGVFNFRVLTVHGTSTCAGGGDFCEGRSNGLGEYTVVVTRTAPGLVEIDVTAALLMSLFVTTPSGAGYSQVEVPLRHTTTVLRESYSIAATFPGTVEPGQAVTLTAVVTRDNPGGIPTPIEGAQLTFDADGGTANPTNGTTNASGSVSTQVTAQSGPNRVVVEIDAYIDGEVVATKFVEAIIDANPNPANFTLLRRTSDLSALEVSPECSGTSSSPGHFEGAGPSNLEVFGNEQCVETDGQGLTITRSRSERATQFSDTGLQSGTITIQTEGTLTAELTCSGDPETCANENARASTLHQVWIEFHISEPVNFEFDGTRTASLLGQFPPQFTVTRIDGGLSDEKMNWGGPQAPDSWDGTLEPGDYRVWYRLSDTIFDNALEEGGVTAWWDHKLTLKLTQVPPPASAGSR